MDTDDLSALIGAVYDAAVDAADWADVLARMAALVDSPFAVLQSLESDSLTSDFHVLVGYDAAMGEFYQRHYARDDLFSRDVSRQPVGAVFTGERLPGYDSLRQSAVYNEWYLPTDQAHVIGAVITRNRKMNTGIGLRRSDRAGPYTETERQILSTLVPHMRRSFELRRRFAGARLVKDGLSEAMDRMVYAVVLVTADARVTDMNERARRLLAAEDGLSVRSGHLAAAAPASRAALDRLIAAMAGTNGGAPPPAANAIPIPRPSCLRPYTVLVAPLPTRHEWSLANDALALVFIRDPEDAPQLATDAIAALYGLTPAEARLAAALAAGQTVKEYAESATVTENTARWTLKQVLAKTETRSQSDLLRLILTGPAALATGDINGS